MKQLDFRVWVIEGKGYYDGQGHLLSEGNSRWTKSALRNLSRSLWTQHGIMCEYTDDVDDTLSVVREWEAYLKKQKHISLLTRQKDKKLEDEWGKFDKRAFAQFFLQGLPRVGVDRAGTIIDYSLEKLGKPVPMSWDITLEDMCKIYGIGKKTARTLMELFE